MIKVLPGLAWPRGYERAWLPGDLLAGVTVAAYLVPQVMVYAGPLLRGFPISSSGSRTALARPPAAAPRHTRSSPWPPPSARCSAAVRLVDLPGFRRLAAFRRTEFALALAACAGVLAFGILYGILVAVGLSVAETLRRVARPHDAYRASCPAWPAGTTSTTIHRRRRRPALVVYRYDSPLFFANAEDFRRRALSAVDGQPEPVAWFVLNTEANVEVDSTALDALERLRAELTGRGIVFALARVKQDLRDDLDTFGLTSAVGEDRIFPTLPTAVAAYQQWREAR